MDINSVRESLEAIGAKWIKENLDTPINMSRGYMTFNDVLDKEALTNKSPGFQEFVFKSKLTMMGMVVTTRKLIKGMDKTKLLQSLRLMVEFKIYQQKEILPKEASQIKCKKGCSACCHQFVGTGQEEAKEIADKIKLGSVSINMDNLKKQAKWTEDEYSKNWREAKCVFLSNSGECKIYDSRPFACRTYMVINDPKYCIIDDEERNSVVQFGIPEAEALVTAYYNETKVDSLAKQVLKELSRT